MKPTPASYFIKRGSEFDVTDSANVDIHDQLPAETFLVRCAPMRGYYLEQVSELTVPTKLYGDTQKHVDRIMTSFQARPTNTGVLLAGEKGSGKTMTMRALALAAQRFNMPTIIINDEHSGDEFNKFMQSIAQPCLIGFDEFEKTYDENAQQRVLTLLDGVFTSRKLFVFTVNNMYKVNQHFLNRPGRMFYSIRFKGLPRSAIEHYCRENLNDYETKLDGVLEVASTLDSFNFDMLKALVEEMNRYNESARDAVQIMNIRPENLRTVTYSAKVTKNGEVVLAHLYDDQRNPLSVPMTRFGIHNPDGPDPVVALQPSDLVRLDPTTGSMFFRKDGYDIEFTKTEFHEFAF